MKRIRLLLTAVFGLMLAACNVESDFLSQKNDLYTETITVSANRDGVDVNGPEGTRAVLTEDNALKSVWEEGDQLTVWTGSDFSEDNMSEGGFTLNSGAGTNSATFMGTVRSTFVPDENTVLTAVIDNDDDMVDCSSGTTAALDFSEQESCTTSTVLHYDALWAQATYGNRNFHFAHTMSFVKWTIKINGITAATTCDITLSASNMRNKATLNLAQGKLSSTNAGDITLKDVRIGADGKAVIYISLFPGYVYSKMSAVVTMADGKITTGQLGTFTSQNFVANKLYTAAWTFDAPVTPTNYTITATSPYTLAYNSTSTGNYTVKSYATVGSTTVPVAWEVTKYEYSDDNGATWIDNGTTKPAWLTTLSLESGKGSTSTSYERGTATVDAASYIIDRKALIDESLRNATAKNNYDLSQGGETANCYVISAPGTYKIPLVIGNARKANGTANTACFNNDSPYVTYKGTAITNMWLKNHGGTPTSGTLVWKDVTTDIVTNLAVSGDFLTFTVPQSAIQQGNAVVAVKDADGVIMWSWHLWFTESGALSTTAFNNYTNETQHFTRDNLGFVYDTNIETTYNTPRRMRVTVTQTGSGNTAQFQIIQNNYSSITFHDTKYQFGRKDALSGSSTGAPTITPGMATYQTSIQNPGTFYVIDFSIDTSRDWCSTTYMNAWAVGNTATYNVSTSAIVKSVYDPCPVGFKMPGDNAFTGFTKDGSNQTTIEKINGTYVRGLGYTFTDSTNGTSVFFPYTGLRFPNPSGEIGGVGSQANFWSAVPSDAVNAWNLCIQSPFVSPHDFTYYTRTYGFGVRPVRSN